VVGVEVAVGAGVSTKVVAALLVVISSSSSSSSSKIPPLSTTVLVPWTWNGDVTRVLNITSQAVQCQGEDSNNHKTSSEFEIPCLLVAKERFFRTPRLHHPLPTKPLPRFRVRPAVFRSSLAHHHYANSNSKLSNITSNDIPVMEMDFHRAMVSIPKGSIASFPKNFATTLLVDHHRRTFVVMKPVEDRRRKTSVAAKPLEDRRRKTSVVVN
jgi:hypothetical protein